LACLEIGSIIFGVGLSIRLDGGQMLPSGGALVSSAKNAVTARGRADVGLLDVELPLRREMVKK
jgi:hypothetical protein